MLTLHPLIGLRCSHIPDLSRRNIFFNDAGTPVSLLDWERSKLKPALFLTRNPDFIDSVKNFDEPEKGELADPERQPDSEDPEEAAKVIKDNEEFYTRNLNDYQCTMLRQTFREKLKDLESPLADAVWDDLPEFDRELLERIIYISAQAEDHVDWVASHMMEVVELEDSAGSGKTWGRDSIQFLSSND